MRLISWNSTVYFFDGTVNEVKVDDEKLKAVLKFCYLGACSVLNNFESILIKICQVYFSRCDHFREQHRNKMNVISIYSFRMVNILMAILDVILFLCSCPMMLVWHSSTL